MADPETILITFKCKKCGEPHEILISPHEIYQYLNKDGINASRDRYNN